MYGEGGGCQRAGDCEWLRRMIVETGMDRRGDPKGEQNGDEGWKRRRRMMAEGRTVGMD